MAKVSNSKMLSDAGVFDLTKADEKQLDVIDNCFSSHEVAALMLMAKRFELDANSGPMKISPGFF